jgi:hypothetical protein
MPTCPRCNKRAAKRVCPALRTKICAVCCARERMIELACPESCPYLRDARSEVGQREAKLRSKDEVFANAARGITSRLVPILLSIESAIVNSQRGIDGTAMSGLKDSEILEAIENTIKNLETGQSGIIYEHPAVSARVEALSRRIKTQVEDLAAEIPAEVRPGHSDILKMLNVEHAAVGSHIKRNETDTSYLRHIALFVPWPEQETRPLII